MPTYYVDATGGNDGNTGLSPAQAWQTIGQINGFAFAPGDTIRFKRGETWVGTALVPPVSGAAGNHITFADYGTGALPIIDGNDAVNCIVANACSYLTFRNLEVTQGVDFGISCDDTAGTPASYIYIYDCVAHDCGNDNVIFIDGAHHCIVDGLITYDPYQRVGGTIVTGLEIADDSHDIDVRHVRAYGSVAVGLSVHCHALEGTPYNLTFSNCAFYSNGTHGVFLHIAEAAGGGGANRNIVFQDCLMYSNTSDGIRIDIAAGAVTYIDGVSFYRCHSYDNTQYPAYLRGDNLLFEHCILADGILFLNAYDTLTLYNCTIHNAVTAGAAIYMTGARCTDFTMKNCIIQCDVLGQYIIVVAAATGVANWDVDYNLYRRTAGTVANTHWYWLGATFNFANWKIQTGDDANSAYGDALFIDVPANNWHLQHGSPALHIGTPIAGMAFYGAAPDCGRWEMRWPSTRTYQHLTTRWRFA